jgi:hypothetical protein
MLHMQHETGLSVAESPGAGGVIRATESRALFSRSKGLELQISAAKQANT